MENETEPTISQEVDLQLALARHIRNMVRLDEAKAAYNETLAAAEGVIHIARSPVAISVDGKAYLYSGHLTKLQI